MKRIGLLFSVLAASVVSGISEEILIDFEQAEIGKPVTNWVEGKRVRVPIRSATYWSSEMVLRKELLAG